MFAPDRGAGFFIAAGGRETRKTFQKRILTALI